MTARIKKGDLVQVIAGKDRGEKGRVLQVVRADLILVEGVNRVKRHQSPRHFREAGILERRRDGNRVLYSIADEGVLDLCESVCGGLERRALHRLEDAEALRLQPRFALNELEQAYVEAARVVGAGGRLGITHAANRVETRR